MKPSFLKFLNFQKQSSLSPQKIEDLHTLLFLSTMSHKFDSKKIKRKLDIPQRLAEKLFIELVKFNVVSIEPLSCPECGEEILDITNCCNNCSLEIDIDEYYVNIDALLNQEQQNLIKAKHLETKKAEIIAREWEKQKYLSYVLIDLVDSENVNITLGDTNFKDFFEEIREIIKFYALSYIKGEYLILGEIGDCIKIAFTRKEDVIIFFKNFSQELVNRSKTSKVIKKYITELEYYPKFSGIVDTLELPSNDDGYISAKNIISITLNGSIDFNSKSLTKLFRLDGGVSIENSLAFKDNNTSLWIGDNFAKDTEFEILNKIELNIGKHEPLIVQRDVSLLLFNNDNPLDYKRK